MCCQTCVSAVILEPGPKQWFCFFFPFYFSILLQIRCWGNVEWAHDYDMYELRARTSAGALFVHLTSESSTVKHKLMQDWIRWVQVLMKKIIVDESVSQSVFVSQYTHKLLFGILLLWSNHSCICDLLENSKFLAFFFFLVIHDIPALHYFK